MELFGALALKIKTHCYASTDEIIGPHKEYHDEDGDNSSSGAYGQRLYIIVSGLAEIVTEYTSKATELHPAGETKFRLVGSGKRTLSLVISLHRLSSCFDSLAAPISA